MGVKGPGQVMCMLSPLPGQVLRNVQETNEGKKEGKEDLASVLPLP